MSSMEAGIHWFIAREGRQHGPVSDLEMRKLVELGHLRHTDLLWRQGFPDWRPAPTVFAGSPAPLSAPNPPRPDRPTNNAASPTVMPRFEATQGRGAMSSAQPGTEASAASAQSRGSFIPQPDNMPQSGAHGFGAYPAAAAEARPRGPGIDQRNDLQFSPIRTEGKAAQPRFDSSATTPYHDVTSATDFNVQPKSAVLGRLLAVASIAALAAGGWYVARNYGADISAFIASKTAISDPGAPTEAAAPAPAPAAEAPTDTMATATLAGAPPADPAATAAAVPVAATQPLAPEKLMAVSAELEKTAHWRLIATEFPDWYRERVAGAAGLAEAGKTQPEISKFLVQSLVDLRRSQAEAALAASSGTLKSLATAFKASVTRLSKEGTPTCMAFIMSGESHDSVVSVINDPARNAELNAHLLAVFTAVAEGRKTATPHADPAEGDYKMLVLELVKNGWTQAELELFADPKGASRTTPERYCQMMQDFFAAHLSIPDPAIQERLLHRTLKLVVAG